MPEQNQSAVVTSGMGQLSVRDLIQGMIMAGLGAAAGLIYPVISAWATGEDVVLNLSLVAKASIGAAVLHLVRKLLSGPTVVITNAPPQVMQAVKSGEATVKVAAPGTPTTIITTEENKN